MNSDYDKILKEYEVKLKQSHEIKNEFKAFLRSIPPAHNEYRVKFEELLCKYEIVDSEIVNFNIGGTLFSTLKSTINKKIVKPNTNGKEFYEPHLLQGFVAGLYEPKFDKNKAIFIDRDPKYFGYLLNYLRSLNTNDVFIPPNKIDDMEGLLKEAQYFKINGINDLVHIFPGSLILDSQKSLNLIHLCEFSDKVKWRLVYRGSLNGFGAHDFHSKCDGIPNTMTVIKTTHSFIFGGFASVPFDSMGHSKLDKHAFIFSLVNQDNKPVKMKFDPENGSYSIQCFSTFGPTFGGGYDFHVADGSNKNIASFSNLGNSYKHPIYAPNSEEAKSFLAGSHNFQIDEIEIYAKI